MGRRRCWRWERLGSMTNGNNYGPASPSPPKIHLQTRHAPHSNLVWKLPSVFCLPLQTLYTRRDPSTNQRLFSQNEPNFRSDENNATPFAAKDYQSKPPLATRRKRTQSAQSQNDPNPLPRKALWKGLPPPTHGKTNPIKPNLSRRSPPVAGRSRIKANFKRTNSLLCLQDEESFELAEEAVASRRPCRVPIRSKPAKLSLVDGCIAFFSPLFIGNPTIPLREVRQFRPRLAGAALLPFCLLLAQKR